MEALEVAFPAVLKAKMRVLQKYLRKMRVIFFLTIQALGETNDFCLMNHQSLDIKDVPCLPAKMSACYVLKLFWL